MTDRPCTCGRPSWDELHEVAHHTGASFYALGVAHGRAQVETDRHRAALHAQAADVVRAAAQDIGTPAASRPRSRGVAA